MSLEDKLSTADRYDDGRKYFNKSVLKAIAYGVTTHLGIIPLGGAVAGIAVGGAIGLGIGAGIDALVASPGIGAIVGGTTGAWIGGVTGAVGGYIYGAYKCIKHGYNAYLAHKKLNTYKPITMKISNDVQSPKPHIEPGHYLQMVMPKKKESGKIRKYMSTLYRPISYFSRS